MTAITLLDGSIGQELVKRSADRVTPLWSTQVMMDHADMVGAVHVDYFNAGATIATTNTYALHRNRLERVGLQDRVPDLVATALQQAEMARAGFSGSRIAGALGPVIASYRPDLKPEVTQAAERFRELAEMMVAHVDLLLIETVCSVQEAEGALRGACGHGVPVWLGVSVDDDDGTRLRSGEPVADIASLLHDHSIEAVLVNCSRPEVVADALEVVRGLGKPFGAYANGFTRISDAFLQDAPTVDVLEQRTDLDPTAYANFAMGWVDQGATIVGGCCEVGPDHIAEIARRLRAAGHDII